MISCSWEYTVLELEGNDAGSEAKRETDSGIWLCALYHKYPESFARKESEIAAKQIKLRSYDDMFTKLEPHNLKAEYKEIGRLECQVEKKNKKEKALILLKDMTLTIPEPKEIFPS